MIGRNPLTPARSLARRIGRLATAQTWEAVLMVSALAVTPLALTGSGLEWTAGALGNAAKGIPPGTNPVVLVHGLAATKSCWTSLTRLLRRQGTTVAVISYPPLGASVEKLADQLVTRIDTVLAETGAQRVNLVGHSMGGLVIAQALADERLSGRIDTAVTIGTPFGGSPWASVMPFVGSVRALRHGSPLLERIRDRRVPDGVRLIAFTAGLDLVVPGDRAVPGSPATRVVTVDDVGHLGILRSRKIAGHIADALLPEHGEAAPATA